MLGKIHEFTFALLCFAFVAFLSSETHTLSSYNKFTKLFNILGKPVR